MNIRLKNFIENYSKSILYIIVALFIYGLFFMLASTGKCTQHPQSFEEFIRIIIASAVIIGLIGSLLYMSLTYDDKDKK